MQNGKLAKLSVHHVRRADSEVLIWTRMNKVYPVQTIKKSDARLSINIHYLGLLLNKMMHLPNMIRLLIREMELTLMLSFQFHRLLQYQLLNPGIATRKGVVFIH